MGAAAYRRGSEVIRRHFDQQAEEDRRRDDRRRAVELTLEADAWRLRLMEDEPRGFLAAAIASYSSGRVYDARLRAVVDAHAAWLESDARDALRHWALTLAYCVAVYRLADWQRGCWRWPALDAAPHSVTSALPKKRRAAPALPRGAGA